MLRDPLRRPTASRRTGYTDLVLAGVALLAFLDAAGVVGVVIAAAAAAAAALRTHLPSAALVLASISVAAQLVSGQVLVFTAAAVVPLIYFCASHAMPVVRFGSGAVVLAMSVVAGWRLSAAVGDGTALGQRPSAEIVAACILVVAFPAVTVWAFGYIGYQRRVAVAGEYRARQLEKDRKQAVERLEVEEERNSIARDIHDVVAHSLTVVIAQAEGAKYSFDSSPDAARRALEVIAQTGRSSLTDVRTFLERLRHRNIPTDVRSYVESRDFLLTQIRAAGPSVDHTCVGEPRDMPALVSVTLYRVLAEALTNSLKYGDLTAPIVVTETWSDTVRLTVTNAVRAQAPDPTAHGREGSGLGSVTIAERVALARGTVTMGPTDAGWAVDARFPVDRPDTSPREWP